MQHLNIYALKNKIKRLEQQNDPKQARWIEFLKDVYIQEQAKRQNAFINSLSEEQRSQKAFKDHLAR